MTEQSIAHYGTRDDIKELANRLQKMMPGAARFTEAEALTVAQIAIAHGLDPFNGEVWGIKYQKNGEWVWAGTMVGVKGLRKAARRQGNYWTEFRRVEPKQYSQADNAVVWECHLRDTDRVQAYGKSINALTSSGMPYSEAIQMLGPAPVYVGVGIATPDEHSKMSIHHRAKKRAEADAIKQAYDVQFGGAMLENGSMVDGEVTVLGFDDDHALPAGQVVDVHLEPRPAENVLVELGVEEEAVPFYEKELVEETRQTELKLLDEELDAVAEQSPIDQVYQAVVNAGLAENVFAAKNALGKCKTGWDTPEKALGWMRSYRGWRDTGLDTKQSAEKANLGEKP